MSDVLTLHEFSDDLAVHFRDINAEWIHAMFRLEETDREVLENPRAKIIDAARRLLADNRDASMRAIAEAAGLGRGTVHRHFSTREDLIDAVRRHARDDADSDEEDYLRPPGELANVGNTPLSIADVLNKVPPFQLGEQIIAEAQRLPGVSSAALYVVDLNGASMQRLAGAATFPVQITAPLAVGPEVPREGVAAIRAVFEELLPGATVVPLHPSGLLYGALRTKPRFPI
jgi:AcrR family transcriptional regulator